MSDCNAGWITNPYPVAGEAFLLTFLFIKRPLADICYWVRFLHGGSWSGLLKAMFAGGPPRINASKSFAGPDQQSRLEFRSNKTY